jgi:hypothetical protein
MKNNLWIFGCSHSTRIFKNNEQTEWVTPYTELLNQKLNTTLISKEQSACGNDFILQSFIENISNFKKDELVIIQLTHFSRNNFYCDIQKEKVFGNYHIKGGVDNDTWMHPVNQSYLSIYEKLFPQTIINIFELAKQIENTLGIKIYIFSIEDWNRYSTHFYKQYFDSKQLIKFGDEHFTSLGEYSLTYKLQTLAESGEKQDGHMSTASHQKVAELIYKYIKENE